MEHYRFQDGLLLSYWDESQTDNNVGDHPGQGLILPIDAHPTFHHWADGTLMRPRIASYDSTFWLEATDPVTLHLNGVVGKIRRQPAVPMFDDTKTWWFNEDEHASTGDHDGRYEPGWYGVNPPQTGTTIRVVSDKGDVMTVEVAPK